MKQPFLEADVPYFKFPNISPNKCFHCGPNRRETIEMLAAAGASIAEIAKAVKLTQHRVTFYLHDPTRRV